MKLPIPDDWNGTDWRCVEIWWPNSVKWLGVLLGMLSFLTRGRIWDERTGTVTDAQNVGWQIWDKNYPLTPCQECPPNAQNGLSEAPCGGGLTVMEDEDMGQVVTDVTVENGKLTVWFGPCCSKTLEDFLSGQTGQDIGDDPLNPTGDPNYVYSACGKANAIVDIVFSIVAAAWDEIDTLPFFPLIIPHIEGAVGYDLDNNHLIDLMSNVVATSLAGFEAADFQDATSKQRILCRLVSMFQDTPNGIPDSATFEAVKAVFVSEVESVWEFTAGVMFSSAVMALGRVDMDTVAKLGAADDTTNCDCPETTEEVFANLGLSEDWRYVYDFRASQHSFTLTDPHTVWTAGLGLWATNLVTGHRADIEATLDFDNVNNGSTLTLVGIVVQTIGDDEYDTNPDTGTNITAPITLADMVPITGNAPANEGTYQIVKPCTVPLGATHTLFKVHNFMEHTTDVSQKVVAIFFAGSGPGPMTA